MKTEIIQANERRVFRIPAVSIHVSESITTRTLLRSWLIALVPHILVVLVFIRYPIALDDMYQYDMLARSIRNGVGYRWYSRADVAILEPYLSQIVDLSQMTFPENGLLTTFRAPGYPLFLAGLYALVPSTIRFFLTRLVQAGLFAFMTPAIIVLSRKMGLNCKAAYLAGFGFAFYPILLLYPVGLASENLFIPLVLFSFLVLIWASEGSRLIKIVMAGLLMGFAMLTRSILAPFVALASLWIARYGKIGRKAGALFLCASFGVCLPWAIRNTMIMQRPAFVESSLGYNLYVGYHPQGNGGFVSKVAILPLTILDDTVRDHYCTTMALRYLQEDPLEAAKRVIQRAVFFAGTETREFTYFYSNNYLGYIAQPWLGLLYLLLIVPWVSTMIFSLLGLATMPKRFTVLVLAFVLAYTVPHLFIMAEPRFHLVLVPVLMPFAAKGWAEWRRVTLSLKLRGTQLLGTTRLLKLAFILFAILWLLDLIEKWEVLMPLMSTNGNRLYLPY
jgi:hypothetical protein